MDMSLSKPQEIAKDREAGSAQSMQLQRLGKTEQLNYNKESILISEE